MLLSLFVSPYSVALILSAFVSFFLGSHAWFGTKKALSHGFALFHTCIFVWSLFKFTQGVTILRGGQFEALKLQYLGLAFLPVTYLLISLALAKKTVKTVDLIFLFLPGILTLLVIATDSGHHWFWTGNPIDRLPLNPERGWAFWLFAVFSFTQIAASIAIMITTAMRTRGIVRRWIWHLIIYLSVPFLVEVIFVLFFFHNAEYDPTPIAFAFMGLFVTSALNQFNLMEPVPYAKNLILESIDTPLLIVDSEGLVVGANEEASRFVPSSGVLEGRLLSEIVPIFAEGDLAEGETREWNHEGVDYLISGYFTKKERSFWRGRIFVFRDVTALTKARREVEEARAMADRANEAKTAFVAAVSHELRNPLNAIIGLVDLDLRSNPPPAIRDDLEVILSSGNIILGLVNDLLDLTKIEAGKMELEQIDFDLHEKALSMLRAFRPIAEKKGIFLDVSIAPGTPRYVNGDPLRYGQVIMNLVSNAIKFTEYGAVTVELASADGSALQPDDDPRKVRILTTVRDSGMGIAPNRLPLLFREFTQADPSISRRFGGTGLGLSICKKLVDLFGGKIEVESQEGGGSLFSFTARFKEGLESEAKAAPPGESSGADRPSLRVLVVDDDPINTVVAKRYIERFGHSSLSANTGAAAVDLLAARDFDLVLLDLSLPDMDGFEACTRIHAQIAAKPGRELPVAAMTARAETGVRSDCAQAGMIDCLAKPLDPSSLERLLASVAAKTRELGPRAASTVQEPWLPAVQSAAPPEQVEPGAPLIDVPALLERLDEDEVFMREILGIFVAEAPERLRSFESAAAEPDIEALHKLTHGLKGSSLSLCAAPLAALTEALEAAFIAARRKSPAVPSSAFPDLNARLERLYALLGATAADAAAILEADPQILNPEPPIGR